MGPTMLPTTKVTEIPVAAAELEKLAAPIVHLKGFASRLLLRGVPVRGPPHAFDVDEETARTEAAVERLLAEAAAARTIVWDGDAFAPGSFTSSRTNSESRIQPKRARGSWRPLRKRTPTKSL